eukprot:scaffold1431_cov346-Pavlova_lutheri.AAC.39
MSQHSLHLSAYSKRYTHRKKGEPVRRNEAGSSPERPWDVHGPPYSCTGRTRPGLIDQNRAQQSALQLRLEQQRPKKWRWGAALVWAAEDSKGEVEAPRWGAWDDESLTAS